MIQRISDPKTGHPVIVSGQVLPGDLTVEQLLGVGSFGSVYAANGPNGRCALKELRPTLQLSPELLRERFDTEAELLQTLAPHPCIPGFLGKFECEDTYFLAEQLIEGRNLSSILQGGAVAFTLPESLAWLSVLTRTLDYMHQKLVLYQDLKPDNILIDAGDAPVLVDFGSARHFAGVNANPYLIFGSPGYVAPELLRNPEGQLDYRSDIYSLGCLSYALLTGHPLTQDQILGKQGIMRPSHLMTEFRPEAKVVSDNWRNVLDQLLVQALHPLPEKRLTNLKQFHERLSGLLTGLFGILPGASESIDRVDAMLATLRATLSDTLHMNPVSQGEEAERDEANIVCDPKEIVFPALSSRGEPATMPVSIYTTTGLPISGNLSCGSPWLEPVEKGFNGSQFRLRVRVDPRKAPRANMWIHSHLVLKTTTLLQIRVSVWAFIVKPDSPYLTGEPLPARGDGGVS